MTMVYYSIYLGLFYFILVTLINFSISLWIHFIRYFFQGTSYFSSKRTQETLFHSVFCTWGRFTWCRLHSPDWPTWDFSLEGSSLRKVAPCGRPCWWGLWQNHSATKDSHTVEFQSGTGIGGGRSGCIPLLVRAVLLHKLIFTVVTWCKEVTHLKGLWCSERFKAGGEGDDRGWDGWMASPTQWTWVWVSSKNCW